MTQEQKDLVINHIAAAFNAYRNGQTAAMNALLDITRKAAKAYAISSIQANVAYLRTNETNDVAERTFCENFSHLLKVRELEKLAKELEAAERERKQAELEAKVAAQNDAEQAVYEQVENEVERREADARIDYAIKQFGRYTQEACAAIRAIEIKKEHKPLGRYSGSVGSRLAAAWQASAQQSDRSAFCALLARINAPEWLVDFLASGRCWMISPLTAAHLMFDHCNVEALEAEQDVYNAVRAYLLSGDERVLGMVDDDTASELAAMQRSLMRELYLEEAIALVLNALKETDESTENRDAQENDADAPLPVAVEYLRNRFLECYDDVQIYGRSMVLTILRCRLVKDEAREAWREVEDKYWDRLACQRQHNRRKGSCEGEYEIAQEFAEAVLPLCKLDELEKLEKELEAAQADDAEADDNTQADEKEWTDDDFAIPAEEAYVETMKAVAVEDMEEPDDVELDEYIKEYRAAHKETRARSLARSLRDFLWTRGFTLADVGKAEWWQTVALRWPSLDEFVAVAKAGGLKNIDKYLRRGLRKANKRRAVRALLRIARAYAETCL